MFTFFLQRQWGRVFSRESVISFAECATNEIANTSGVVRPMFILRQCRNVLRRDTTAQSRVEAVVTAVPVPQGPSGPPLPPLLSIILCLLNTYTPTSPLIVLINTCVLGGPVESRINRVVE